MKFTLPVEMHPEDFAHALSWDEAKSFIFAIDRAMASYEFTEEVVKHLLRELAEECKYSGEPFDVSSLLS